MINENELIVNSSYKDFFLNPDAMRKDAFILPEVEKLNTLESTRLTSALGLLLKNIDEKKDALYGIEIKSNGSERSSRIPLVRFTKESVSIWKIASGVNSLEKSATVLNDLLYFLKEQKDIFLLMIFKEGISSMKNKYSTKPLENISGSSIFLKSLKRSSNSCSKSAVILFYFPHSSAKSSACLSTVSVAIACLSGG